MLQDNNACTLWGPVKSICQRQSLGFEQVEDSVWSSMNLVLLDGSVVFNELIILGWHLFQPSRRSGLSPPLAWIGTRNKEMSRVGDIAAATLFPICRHASNCGCFPCHQASIAGHVIRIPFKLTTHMPSHSRHENGAWEEDIRLLMKLSLERGVDNCVQVLGSNNSSKRLVVMVFSATTIQVPSIVRQPQLCTYE